MYDGCKLTLVAFPQQALESIIKMSQQQPPSADKLQQTCVVKCERLAVFICGICYTVYCEEESLLRHIDTHVKCEDTLAYNIESPPSYDQMKSDGTSTSAMSENTYFVDNSMYPRTRQPYVPIRDRIMFESDSDDALSGTESLDDSVMRLSSDSASLSNYYKPMKIELNATSSNSDVINMNFQGSKPQDCKRKKSKVTSVFEKHIQIRNKQIETVTQYTCDVCNKSFSKKTAFNKHVKLHTLEKTFKCEYCEKKFMFNYQLKNHQRTHNKKTPYLCQLCNIFFRNHKVLSFHKCTAYTNFEGPVEATDQLTCQGQVTTTSGTDNCVSLYGFQTGQLLAHDIPSKTHTSKVMHQLQTYKCDTCKKNFMFNEELKVHQCVNTDEKQYSCIFCNMSYKYYKTLCRHKYAAHSSFDDPNVATKQLTCQGQGIITSGTDACGPQYSFQTGQLIPCEITTNARTSIVTHQGKVTTTSSTDNCGPHHSMTSKLGS